MMMTKEIVTAMINKLLPECDRFGNGEYIGKKQSAGKETIGFKLIIDIKL